MLTQSGQKIPETKDRDQPGIGDEIEQAWDEEIRARVRAVDDGRANGVAYEHIKNEMAGRFARKERVGDRQ